MKPVAKYNTFKGVSTALTVGTPLVTLACCGNLFVHRSETAISVAGIFAIALMMLLFKDKIAEHWKTPSAFIVSTAMLVLIMLVEHIIAPMKYVCLTTMAATAVDELTFKRFYKNIELLLPETAIAYKKFGFLFVNSDKLLSMTKEK
jgi:hypothetical protein